MKFLSLNVFNLKNLWRFIFGFLFGAAIIVAELAVYDGFGSLIFWYDAFFTGSFGTALIGLLAIVSNTGFFNIFSFYFDRKKIDGVRENYTKYSERKRENRSREKFAFLAYFFVTLFFIFCGFVCYILTIWF